MAAFFSTGRASVNLPHCRPKSTLHRHPRSLFPFPVMLPQVAPAKLLKSHSLLFNMNKLYDEVSRSFVQRSEAVQVRKVASGSKVTEL